MAEVQPSETEQSNTEDELGKTAVKGDDKQDSVVTVVENKVPQLTKASGSSKQIAKSRKPRKRKR